MIPSVLTRQLARAHDDLIHRLVTDRQFAILASRRPSYSCIGDWLSGEGSPAVLELGCGPGKFVAMLSQLGCRVTGVDPISFPSWQTILNLPGVTLMSEVRAESLPFPDNHFDSAACMGALLYFDSVTHGLDELHRVLKPGGRAIVRTVNRDNIFTSRTGRRLDPASKHLFTMQELSNLMEASGFRVERGFSHGYFPGRLNNLWWYLANVVIPERVLDWLSDRTAPSRRVNNTLFLTKVPKSV